MLNNGVGQREVQGWLTNPQTHDNEEQQTLGLAEWKVPKGLEAQDIHFPSGIFGIEAALPAHRG